jgi:hypothetical protein
LAHALTDLGVARTAIEAQTAGAPLKGFRARDREDKCCRGDKRDDAHRILHVLDLPLRDRRPPTGGRQDIVNDIVAAVMLS